MKILTNKQQKESLSIITDLRHVLINGSELEKLEALEELAELTYLLCGIRGLKAELEQINFETHGRGKE